jgi:polysaccharide pyruvyl transferase CsaB
MHILLCGYYGCHNAGDDATLHAVLDSIRDAVPQVKITVLSGDPEDTAKRYRCLAVDRFSIPAVLRAMWACDALVFGGGSLLQDVTSTRSLLYYLLLLRMARMLGKKTMLFGNGIGPVCRAVNRRRVAAAVKKTDCITLRDEESLLALRKMGVDRPDLTVTADPVFAYRTRNVADSLLRAVEFPEHEPFVAVSMRSWMEMDAFCVQAAAACDVISKSYNRRIVFITMHPEFDRATSEKIAGLMKSQAYILPAGSASQLMAALKRADMVLSMRLHALIFAARMGVPAVGIVYDPKTKSFLDRMGMPSCGDVASFTAEKAVATMQMVLDERESYAERVRIRSAALEQMAQENTKAFLRMMSSEKGIK